MSTPRYSDRKQLAEAGTLGDLKDEVSPELATAIKALLETVIPILRSTFFFELRKAGDQHFGDNQEWSDRVVPGPVDPFLDFVEIAAEISKRPVHVVDPTRNMRHSVLLSGFEPRVDQIFVRHRFGYRIEDGLIVKISSPALDQTIVHPALLAVQRPGWEEVERTYREAITHQRARETDDALTAASAAVEAGLKAIGMQGNALPQLADSFKRANVVPGYLQNVPDLLADLLDRLHAARSQQGDAHGRAPGAPDPHEALASLGVNWAGSFLVYLADVTP